MVLELILRNYLKNKRKKYFNGNILATENQQVRIINAIEVKSGVYLHKT